MEAKVAGRGSATPRKERDREKEGEGGRASAKERKE